MSDAELMCFIAGCIAGFVLVGVLVIVNARMKAGEPRARGLSTQL